MRARARRSALCGLVLGLVTSAMAPAVARAEPSSPPSVSEQMLAQSLFEEGRQLMDRGKYAEACPKLAESQRLDPGGGTLLNLAICHEKEGRFGTAYLEMKSASSQSVKENRKDREQIANEHLATLASRVPRLAVHVVREIPDLEVRVDGTVLRKPAWDLLTVVDPGPHVIDASAPGKAPFRQTLTLNEGQQRTVQVPALDTSAGVQTAGPSSSGSVTAPATATATATPAPEMQTNPLFVAAIATGVTGFAVGIPAGYLWVMMTIVKSSCTPQVASSSGPFCTSEGVRDAWFAAAAIGLTVGTIGTIGIAVVPRKIQVTPVPTRSGAAVILTGEL